MTDGLFTEVSDGVARIVIDRPDARNALTADILQAMIAFVRAVEHDPAARVVLITGRGQHFMAGGDVKGMVAVLERPKPEIRADFEQRSIDAAPLWLALQRLPQPVVCSVRGYAAGAALSFVASADFAIASDTARFLLAHVGIGLVADAGTSWLLPRIVGTRKAKEMAFLGDRIDATEALAIGLITRLVPDSELDSEVEALLRRLISAPAVSLAQAKRLMNVALGHTLAEQLELESQAVGACGASDDFAEGVTAFVEKRKPVFGAQAKASAS